MAFSNEGPPPPLQEYDGPNQGGVPPFIPAQAGIPTAGGQTPFTGNAFTSPGYAQRRRLMFGSASPQGSPSVGTFGAGGPFNASAWTQPQAHGGMYNNFFSPGIPGLMDKARSFRLSGQLDPRSQQLQDLLMAAITGKGDAGPYSRENYLAGLMPLLQQQNADNRTQALLGLRARDAGNLDPSAYAYGALQSDIQGGHDMTAALAQALASYGDWQRGLLGSAFGHQNSAALQDQQAKLASWLQSQAQGGGLGGALGQIAGGALGSWLAPGGWFKGAGGQ